MECIAVLLYMYNYIGIYMYVHIGYFVSIILIYTRNNYMHVPKTRLYNYGNTLIFDMPCINQD